MGELIELEQVLSVLVVSAGGTTRSAVVAAVLADGTATVVGDYDKLPELPVMERSRPDVLFFDLQASLDHTGARDGLDAVPAPVICFNTAAATSRNRATNVYFAPVDATPAALLSMARGIVLPGVRRTPSELGPAPCPHLTSRQAQVLALAANGLSNSEIAATLFISPGTVKRHLSDTYLALGARSRIEAINRASALGYRLDLMPA